MRNINRYIINIFIVGVSFFYVHDANSGAIRTCEIHQIHASDLKEAHQALNRSVLNPEENCQFRYSDVRSEIILRTEAHFDEFFENARGHHFRVQSTRYCEALHEENTADEIKEEIIQMTLMQVGTDLMFLNFDEGMTAEQFLENVFLFNQKCVKVH